MITAIQKKVSIEKVYDNFAEPNLTTDASIINPKIFKVYPVSGMWKILRICIHMLDNNKFSDEDFIGISGGVVNGVLFKVSGKLKSMWRTNGDISIDTGIDLRYQDKTETGAYYGGRARWTFQRAGVALTLESFSNSLEIHIQDNLTSAFLMKVKAQGYLV